MRVIVEQPEPVPPPKTYLLTLSEDEMQAVKDFICGHHACASQPILCRMASDLPGCPDQFSIYYTGRAK